MSNDVDEPRFGTSRSLLGMVAPLLSSADGSAAPTVVAGGHSVAWDADVPLYLVSRETALRALDVRDGEVVPCWEDLRERGALREIAPRGATPDEG